MIGSRREPGFTLIEVLLASALLSFIVAAVCQPIAAGQMQTVDTLHGLRGLALAEQLMEEVQALPYADPQGATTVGPDAGETSRALYDNCDDYHGFTQAANAISDGAGTLFPSDYQRFTTSVTASYGTVTLTGLGTGLKGLNVTVTVREKNGRAWVVRLFFAEPAS
jgi:prepilin-type N-terminal cleavage/methylation domain-containing protein